MFVALLWVSPGGSARPLAPAATSSSLSGIDAYIESVMAEWKVPGLAVALVKDGTVLLSKGYGFRDLDRKTPTTPQTLFAIGSNSKSFTVTLMGMLADEGKVDWDKPVREYMPDFRLHDPVATAEMTPRDLTCHRSGLPRHDLLWLASGLSRRELYDRLRFLEPNKPFRSLYQYQNLMFMTAGVLEERLTGTSWENLVRERIFRPLGMKRSNLSVVDLQNDADHAEPYAQVKGKVERVPPRNIDAIGPAGSINSSVEEMIRYVQFHLDQGKVGDKQLLSAANAREMQSAQVAQPPAPEEFPELGPASYGLGLGITTYRGHKLVSHGGGIDGFISQMTWLPNDKIGAIVLTNYSGTNPVPALVVRQAVDLLLGLEPIDWRTRARTQQEKQDRAREEAKRKSAAERKPGTKPTHDLADFAGTYRHAGYGAASVQVRGSSLEVRVAGLALTLEHFHYDVFSVGETPAGPLAGARCVFGYDKKGEVDRLSIPLEPNVPDIVFTRAERKSPPKTD
jgi:CubicO group peptidase (beta-lactamase class C family)